MAPDKEEQVRQINQHAAPLLVDFEAARAAGADLGRMTRAIVMLELSVQMAKKAIGHQQEVVKDET